VWQCKPGISGLQYGPVVALVKNVTDCRLPKRREVVRIAEHAGVEDKECYLELKIISTYIGEECFHSQRAICVKVLGSNLERNI
jgi:hypothetical protein